MTTKLRSIHLSWPAILLFTALLAQAPHAAAVFIRIAPHDAQWEIVTSFIGAWVYAIALEGATAYFVWRSKLRWAIAFAAFSIAHNIAYYLSPEWIVTVYGVPLTVRYVFSAILISMSLPIAIAAFSHVQAEDRKRASQGTNTHPVHPQTPVALPSVTTGHSEHTPTTTEDTDNGIHDTQGKRRDMPQVVSATPETATPATPAKPVRKKRKPAAKATPEQRRAQIVSAGLDDAGAIAATFNVSVRTAQMDLEQIRKMTVTQNGATHA